MTVVLGILAAGCTKKDSAAKPADLATTGTKTVLPVETFLALIGTDEAKGVSAITQISDEWDDRYSVMMLECYQFVIHRRIQFELEKLMARVTGVRFTGDIDRWYEWLWAREPMEIPEYAQFKSQLYEKRDPRFREYFTDRSKSIVRWDEIRWGGVLRDGIPPLKNPKMISAAEATWLADDNVVFGVALNGDVRAYPKRILAWHEMFKDKIGGIEVNGVYCTLCGSLILYDSDLNGVHHELGTSGFLYRSNKMMYDHETKSMWSTLDGIPVVGPLVDKGIKLKPLYVVTTTWKEWRTRHPETTVLSLDTGHERDYGEGVAYKRYFDNDDIMFTVPKHDNRLANKAEVLAIRSLETKENLAISAEFLIAHPVYHDKIGEIQFVVLTDASGANRAFHSAQNKFASWDNAKNTVQDESGGTWQVSESELTGGAGEKLERFPAHRAFWFGWFAAFPDTRLVK